MPRIRPGETDQSAIEALIARFMGAWNQHDAHAFAALFAEDADFTNWRGAHARGRKAVEELHAPLFTSAVFKDSHQTCRLRNVRFLKPDVAIADVDWEMTGAVTPEGAVRPLRKGLLDWAMVKTNGRWQIAVMHNTDFSAQAM
jgi:uncharacterized protein (TIGR02246 family)